jgi:hypothetical protein
VDCALQTSAFVGGGWDVVDAAPSHYRGTQTSLTLASGFALVAGASVVVPFNERWGWSPGVSLSWLRTSDVRQEGYLAGGEIRDGIDYFRPTLELPLRWSPSPWFVLFGPRVGALLLTGHAGTGSSRATLSGSSFTAEALLRVGREIGDAYVAVGGTLGLHTAKRGYEGGAALFIGYRF